MREVVPYCRAGVRILWLNFGYLFIHSETREAHASQLEVANKVTFNQREAQEEI